MTPTPSASTDADRRSIAAWNATAADPCDGAMLHARFEKIVARMPDETAVIFGEHTLTYAELNRRANQLAHFLRAQNVGPESRVGISMHRSFEMLVAIFGVLKAGAGYVPLDPAVPAERLSYMLADAQLALTLTQKRFRRGTGFQPVEVRQASLPAETVASDSVPLLALDTDWPRIAAHADTNPPAAPFTDSLVYVTYTSGSTGRPKGILMTQRPLLNLLGWMLRTTQLPPRARTLQFASLSFDVSFQDIFSTLLTGGTLVLITEAQRQDLAGLAGLLDRHGVHRIFLPAVALQQLAVGFCAGKFACKELRKIISGSEQLVITDAIRRLFTALPECRLHNEYGPSETHVVTELAMPASLDAWVKRPAVGKPIANTQIHILDPRGNPVPIGELGELHIGGAGLARGYLGREELTAEKFIPDPHSSAPGARLYRTGDQARWLASGDIEFIGRLDLQIKIRGYRVEPGDIETALERHPLLRDTCVVARDADDGGKRLTAYLVAHDTAPNVTDLRAFLADKLPDYMIPSAFVFLNALPLNANGKIDRAALPAPTTTRPQLAAAFAAPTNDTEQFLATLWREVLHLDRVGVRDNFFDLGGDSVLLVQIHQRLETHFHREVPITALFEHPTIADLAQHLTADGTHAAARQQTIADRAARQRAALTRR